MATLHGDPVLFRIMDTDGCEYARFASEAEAIEKLAALLAERAVETAA